MVLQFVLSLVVPAALRIPTTFGRIYVELESALNRVVDEVYTASRLKESADKAEGSSMIDRLCVHIYAFTLIIQYT